MARLIKVLFIAMCAALLALGVIYVATAQPKEIPNTAGTSIQKPLEQVSVFLSSRKLDEVREDVFISLPATPGTWFGLAASLAGTMLFWLSVMHMARRMRK